MSKMKKSLFFTKKFKFLNEIGNQGNSEKPLTKLYSKSYAGFGKCSKTTKEFENFGLITTIKTGRERHAKLTKKGEEILQALNKIKGILE